MKILGVNISHDTSCAVIEDGEVVSVYEEERSRRSKWWSPTDDSSNVYEELGLLSIDHKQLHRPDLLTFASFDRRDLKLDFKDRVLKDRVLQGELISVLSEQQLTRDRLEYIAKTYKDAINPIHEHLHEDELICQSIAKQCQVEKYNFIPEHHYFHAVCGSHLSPYDECIVITWDGGGYNSHWQDYPRYQEIECIWHYKDNKVEALWKRYSNHRFVSELQDNFPGYGEDCLHCKEDLEVEIDGVPSVFTSYPSMGMNFSNMSYALGCDEKGRAAGKVMGMASYGDMHPKVFTKHTVAQQLEHVSLEHSKEIIQYAIDMVPDCKNIVLSGGYSLNCTNNYKYLQAFPDHQFFVDPIPHDGGTAVGAALHEWRKLNADD
jgi:carbamoyltransferase|tara:strand:+ start:799 stop:1929 length:1131 start_codon:yes stop_codon:yes gene_type:complete